MTLTHVLLLQWKPGTPDSAVEPGLKKLRQIHATETYILSYRIGKDDSEFGKRGMNYDVAVVAEFATEDDYKDAGLLELTWARRFGLLEAAPEVQRHGRRRAR